MALDQSVHLLLARTQKKSVAVLPHALQYATTIIGPLVDKIDSIDLTRKSRELKVASDYATRVMRPYYPLSKSKDIASKLVERYSTHGFVIDRDEAGYNPISNADRSNQIGLNISEPNEEVENLFTQMVPFLKSETLIGRMVEA